MGQKVNVNDLYGFKPLRMKQEEMRKIEMMLPSIGKSILNAAGMYLFTVVVAFLLMWGVEAMGFLPDYNSSWGGAIFGSMIGIWVNPDFRKEMKNIWHWVKHRDHVSDWDEELAHAKRNKDFADWMNGEMDRIDKDPDAKPTMYDLKKNPLE
jgi:hypothetical protein